MIISYKLSKDEYMDFVRYEALHRDDPEGRKKFFMTAVAVCAAILAAEIIFCWIIKFNEALQLVEISGAMFLVMLIGLYGMMSEKNRINALYVKYGFNKVEKTNMYPKITIDFADNEFIITSDKAAGKQVYKYGDIEEIVRLEHMIMFRMNDKSWQFISRKVFNGQNAADDFRAFIDGKISLTQKMSEEA